MTTSTSLPRLELAFAAAGFASGWLYAGFLGKGGLGLAVHHDPWLVAALGAAAGALVGRFTRRYGVRSGGHPGAAYARVAGAVLAASLVVGGVAGLVICSRIYDFAPPRLAWLADGAGVGLLGGLAFTPTFLFVVRSARRAARARHGSIVAASDRRAVWGILAATLSVVALAGAPSWSHTFPVRAAYPLQMRVPIAPAAVALGCLAVCGLVVLFDLLGRRRLRELSAARRHMDRCSVEQVRARGRELPSADVGLGETAHVALGAARGYRDAARWHHAIVGDVDEALRALRQALRAGTIRLTLPVLALLAHGVGALLAG